METARQAYDCPLKDTKVTLPGGAMVSMTPGKALAYSLFNLQERGSLLIRHGEEVYEGMIVGVNSRSNDLPVNPTKGKQLTKLMQI